MKGLLATLLMLASTTAVYAQQNQSDFNPRRSTENNAFAPQTRLAALQTNSSIDNESDKYVIMDDEVDFSRTSSSERSGQRPFFGPKNDPRIRNAVREQPRYSAQSSQRSATSVLPSRNDRYQDDQFEADRYHENLKRSNDASDVRFVSNQTRNRFSIYDLQITPSLEDELKRKGYLYAPTNSHEASSDQIRLYSDSRRANNPNDEAKIFASRVSTYQGNLIIDIDDNDLQRIEEGAYTLDDFNRYDARGVVLRYVSRNNDKVDVTRLQLGQTDNYADTGDNYRSREAVDNRVSPREPAYRTGGNDRRRRGQGDGYGDWTLPNARDVGRVDDRRDDSPPRTVQTRDRREFRDTQYDPSPIRRNYQDRMADIYRDDTRRQPTRLIDRRDDRRYDDISFNDRRPTSSPSRDLLKDRLRERELEQGFVELSDWQRELAAKTEQLEEQRLQLERLNLQASVRDPRYSASNDLTRPYRPVDLSRLYDTGSAVTAERFADRRLLETRDNRAPYLGGYSAMAPVGEKDDPEFIRYAKQNEDQLSRINKKIAAIDQSNKLYALENQVDAERQKQQLKQSRGKLNNVGTVSSFNDDGLVRNTLGGNMAAGRNGYPNDRLAANVGTAYPNGSNVAELSMRSGRPNYVTNLAQQPVASGGSDKLVRALWFIALMSIGMNLYLALLARSFYARYNELADELRETFTTAI